MKVSRLAAMEEKGPLEMLEYESRGPADMEVEVAISHCGVCYSDVLMIDNALALTTYPFVPGHEIVGHVTRVGGRVEAIKIGDRVGIGWQARSCGRCEWCIRGEENLCENLPQTATWSPHGGFASSIVVDIRFAFLLPESLESETAGPLMCAGITTYAALRTHARPAAKVGVIGIGGLGHIALQFAAAFGCEVTAYSTSPEKEEDVYELGANFFVDIGNTENAQKMNRCMDLLISFVHADINWTPYMTLLKPNGKLCIIGFPPNEIKISPLPLIFGQLSVCGRIIGSRSNMHEMLEFAARHEIKTQVEVLPMSEVNYAIARIKNNKARYRIVLKNDFR